MFSRRTGRRRDVDEKSEDLARVPSAAMSVAGLPRALPHDKNFREIFDNVFFMKGAMTNSMLCKCTAAAYSRSMVVVRTGGSLTIINSLRLSEAGLAKLNALGDVKHVIRIAAAHGRDDLFYKRVYGAKVWAVEGTKYVRGLNYKADAYFTPDVWMNASTVLPIPHAKLAIVNTAYGAPEGSLLLRGGGGVLISGDNMHNWDGPDKYFNLEARILLPLIGMTKPCQMGPMWKVSLQPDMSDLRALLDLPWDSVLPSHGEPVLGGAKEKYRESLLGLCPDPPLLAVFRWLRDIFVTRIVNANDKWN